MKKKFTTLFIALSIIFTGYAQLSQKSIPESFKVNAKQQTDAVKFLSKAYSPPETTKEESLPLYAGYKIQIPDDAVFSGKWIKANGAFIWQITFEVDQAEGLNLYLKNIKLHSSDKLFVYSENQETVLGAFTNENNGGFLATEFIEGKKIVVELNSAVRYDQVPFEFNDIGISVNKLNWSERGFGDSRFCEVLINCPEGEDWQSEKRGVSRILVSENSSLFWCTGVLMNNTNLDGTPYLLLANHCGIGATQDDYDQWLFYFNFEAEDCEFPLFEPNHQSLSGASLLAKSSNSTSTGSDFKLLLLNDNVPKSYGPFYNGWDRSGNAADNGTTIHHPEGDLKMISTYEDPLVSTRYNSTTPDENGQFWKVNWSETETNYGVTEPGSSGSPIYSEYGYVVGTLSGGRASCSSPELPDYYGKFSEHWQSNGSASNQQLKPWLDPTNSGVEQFPGSTLDTNTILANFSSNATDLRVGGSVTYYNQSEGEISSYKWIFEGGEPAQSEMENPPAVQYINVGNFDVTLIASSFTKSDTLIRKDYVKVLPKLTPNPSAGHFQIIFGAEIPEDLKLQVTDLRGKDVNVFVEYRESNIIIIDLSQHSSGVYLIRLTSEGHTEVLKAMLINNSSGN